MKTIGLDKMLQKITSFILLFTFISFISCESEESPIASVINEDAQQINCCRAIMNIQSEGYSDEGTTRTVSEAWEDGTTIYVTLHGNSMKCEGKVVYTEEDGSWAFYYDGILPNGDYSGTAYYIKGVSQTSNNILSFNAETPVYLDTDITCQRKSEGVWISLVLHPQTGRIRFIGDANKNIKVSGVWSYSAFDITNKERVTGTGSVIRYLQPIHDCKSESLCISHRVICRLYK